MGLDLHKLPVFVGLNGKFYYWGDLPTYVYFINEELDYYRMDRKFKDDIEINKDYYDSWIAYASYKIRIKKEENVNERIEDDKLFRHKLDWEYIEALKYFSDNYVISCDFGISIDDIFCDIYDRILKYGSLTFYKKWLIISKKP